MFSSTDDAKKRPHLVPLANSQSVGTAAPLLIAYIFWQMCSLDFEEYVASFHTLQDRPLAQSHL